MSAPRAVVLLSGGLDSATALAIARSEGFDCYTLSLDYGQRHRAELDAAARVAKVHSAIEHRVVTLGLDAIGGSALTDSDIEVPTTGDTNGIPVTYVPARNTVFLSLALGYAEVLGAQDIFIGVNAVDYSGYPDCRPEFIGAFADLTRLATKRGVESGQGMHIHTPLIDLSKAQIIQRGSELGVNYAQTVSCYQADEHGAACGVCDSCRFRAAGFADAKIDDPTVYQQAQTG